jgi:hypothetical protein
MSEREFSLRKTLQQKWPSRRDLVRGAGTVLGASLLRSNSVYASSDEEDKLSGSAPRLQRFPLITARKSRGFRT